MIRRALWEMLILAALAAVLACISIGLRPDARAKLFSRPLREKDELLLEEAIHWKPPPVWIDVRSRAAFERGHMEGAYLLTLDEKENFEALLFELDKQGVLNGSRPVVVYCDPVNCALSREVAERLRQRYPSLVVFRLHNRL